jgi:hypothetical protein
MDNHSEHLTSVSLTAESLATLKAIQQGATQEWELMDRASDGYTIYAHGFGCVAQMPPFSANEKARAEQAANARFVAVFDPELVGRLLAVAEAAQQAQADIDRVWRVLPRTRDALRSKLTALAPPDSPPTGDQQKDKTQEGRGTSQGGAMDSWPCGVLHGNGAHPRDPDGCVLPEHHEGPHEYVARDGEHWQWETDLECECEWCMTAQGDYCTTYWRKSDSSGEVEYQSWLAALAVPSLDQPKEKTE